MNIFTVDLKKEYGLKGGTVTAYVADTYVRPAIVVVPGGGYSHVSPREGEPIALEFLARGYHCFVLEYTIGGPNGLSYPEQLLELSAAMDYVRNNAEELRVRKEEVYAIGASAGGHLVGTLCVGYEKASEIMGRTLNCKPTAVGLMYPVISKNHGHQGSYNNLLYGYSEEEKEELLKLLNLNEAVTENTPPAYIFSTRDDQVVPADNAIRYALALADKGVLYELHVYPNGRHGLSTGRAEVNGGVVEHCPRLVQWLDECDAFFRLCAEKQKQ